MTKEEALKIPELKIFPNGLLEDCFYYKLAKAGRLSEEEGRKALERVEAEKNNPLYEGCLIVADLMVKNLDQFGVACAAWCKE